LGHAAHAVKGNYYAKQLRPAPTPGEDFNFEVKMHFYRIL